MKRSDLIFPLGIALFFLSVSVAAIAEETGGTMSADVGREEAVAKLNEMVESGESDRATLEEIARVLGVSVERKGKVMNDTDLQNALVRATRSRKKRGNNYEPGELEHLQEANLAFLKKKTGSFVEEAPTRAFQLSHEKIEWAASNIDKILQERLRETEGEFNELTTDEQFVRRIYLDAAGRIPTFAEATGFLSDRSPTKRRDLIDTLLLSEDYPSQMYNWLADLMRVRDKKGAPAAHEGYQAWLMDQAAGNRPWNETVYDLLTAEGNIVTNPAVGWIERDEGVLTNNISNTLTTFMGADVSCAECHDHPFADWTQHDFYELAAFFGQTIVPGAHLRALSKFQMNHMHFVLDDPGEELTFPEDYSYDDAEPGSKVTPAFPLMQKLALREEGTTEEPLGRKDFAAWMTNKDNEQFAATIANRLWHKAFGRAPIEPMTVMDDLQVADNPRLMTTLASLMRFLKFDLMEYQRILYNTRAYQAKSSLTPDTGEPYRFAGPVLRRMSAEQAWDSLLVLARGDAVNDIKRPRKLNMWARDVIDHTVFADIRRGSEKDGAGAGRVEEFKLLLEQAEEQTRNLLSDFGGGGQSGFKGIELGGKLARASELGQPMPESHFLRQFGQSERELVDGATTEGGVPQVLMMLNGNEVKAITHGESHLSKLVSEARSSDEGIEKMYLSFFSRRPTSSEQAVIRERGLDTKDLTWTLMNAREFIFVQ